MTIDEFIKKEQITVEVLSAHENPNMPDMGPGARHWSVKFEKYGRGGKNPVLITPFSQGSAHKRQPTAAEVLDCLASDAAGIENARCFEDWAADYGYDMDSRKAEKTYQTCVKQVEELKAFLGTDAYKVLVGEIERL